MTTTTQPLPFRPSADYVRIERAIRFLETNARHQPSLAEVARHVGLSEFHFQRVFSRWAGVSPKRFLQFLTVDYARGLLRDARSTMDVAYETGLSGPGRLHDLVVSVDAVTPGDLQRAGAGLTIRYGEHDSPFGPCLVGTTDRGLCWLSFVPRGESGRALAALKDHWHEARIEESQRATREVAARVFGRARTQTSAPLPLLLKGTNFQLKVWEALLRIPAGAVTTYQDVARQIDAPDATRAVGTAVGHNPIAFVIPCHRVIRATGAFGEYRWGAERKKAMLGWEAARTSSHDAGRDGLGRREA